MTPLEAATKAAEVARTALIAHDREREVLAAKSRELAGKVKVEQLKELLRSKL